MFLRDDDDLRLDGLGDPLPRGAGWADDAATDGTPETREYLLQNWRADVVAVYANNGTPFEHIRYSPYGVPTAVAPVSADVDGNGGEPDIDDILAFDDAFNNGLPAGDFNRSGGVVDIDDIIAFWHAFNRGWTEASDVAGSLTLDGGSQRRGYAGYDWDPTLVSIGLPMYHVRHRAYLPEIGRWTRRDPLGYIDGMSTYEYVRSGPMDWRDINGTRADRVISASGIDNGLDSDLLMNAPMSRMARIDAVLSGMTGTSGSSSVPGRSARCVASCTASLFANQDNGSFSNSSACTAAIRRECNLHCAGSPNADVATNRAIGALSFPGGPCDASNGANEWGPGNPRWPRIGPGRIPAPECGAPCYRMTSSNACVTCCVSGPHQGSCSNNNDQTDCIEACGLDVAPFFPRIPTKITIPRCYDLLNNLCEEIDQW